MKRPDILLVVGDCVRVTSLSRLLSSSLKGGNLAHLASVGTVFDAAISPASWTLPAHASLFTGRYPWEHGTIWDGSRLEPSYRTIAEEAHEAGYRTAAFSSNPLISPKTGLSRGFEVSHQGAFSDCFVRSPRQHPVPFLGRWFAPKGSTDGRGKAGPVNDRFNGGLKRVIESFPGLVDVPIRTWGRMQGSSRGSDLLASPWIEDELAEWLSTRERAEPVFCFVNYLDAHEPFVALDGTGSEGTDLRSVHTALRWTLRVARQRGEVPPKEVLRTIEELYDATLEIIDRRVGKLLQSFETYRDLENTAVIFLGDHGQSFEPRGDVFHGRGVSDEVYRVPLVISHPAGGEGAAREREWVSTKDVAAYVSHTLNGSQASGPAIRSAFAPKAGSPSVWAISGDFVHSTGHPRGGRKRPPAGATAVSLLCYSGKGRVIFDATGSPGVFEPLGDGPPSVNVDPTLDMAGLSLTARTFNRALLDLTSERRAQAPGDRIGSWGYD